MPGIVGLIDSVENSEMIKRMIDRMNHFNYHTEYYSHKGVHLGRLDLNYINTQNQPVFSNDKRYALVMNGELFSYNNSPIPKESPHSNFFLNLYLTQGLDCLPKLNGHFSVCLYDFLEKELILISDRLGTRPHYYLHQGNQFAFAPEMKGLKELNFRKELNYHAVSELFTYSHLLGNKTLFKQIHQLPPASYLIYKNQKITIHSYWEPHYDPSKYFLYKGSINESNQYSDKLYHLFSKAVERNIKDTSDNPIFFPFSAGLDSRWVIALAKEQGLHPLNTVTFGQENCEEQVYAEKVANYLNTNHYKYSNNLNPLRFFESARQFAYLLDSIYKINGHLFFYHDFYKHFHISLSGQGSNIFGGTLHRRNIKPLIGAENFNPSLVQNFINIYKTIDHNLLPIIFEKDFFSQIKDKYLATIDHYTHSNMVPLHSYYKFLLKEHIRKGTFGGNIYSNLFYETRMPTLDNDLVEFAFNIPLYLKKNRFLYRNTFTRHYPQLASVPRDGTGLPINVSNKRLEVQRVKKEIEKRMRNAHIDKFLPFFKQRYFSSYTDYNKWFRKELKKNMEQTLFSEKAISRGIYCQEGLKKIINNHISGKSNHSNLILQLLNLEFFFQNFFDE